MHTTAAELQHIELPRSMTGGARESLPATYFRYIYIYDNAIKYNNMVAFLGGEKSGTVIYQNYHEIPELLRNSGTTKTTRTTNAVMLIWQSLYIGGLVR